MQDKRIKVMNQHLKGVIRNASELKVTYPEQYLGMQYNYVEEVRPPSSKGFGRVLPPAFEGAWCSFAVWRSDVVAVVLLRWAWS